MTIQALDSPQNATQRHLYVQRPDAGFFAAFKQAYAASAPSLQAHSADLANSPLAQAFGRNFMELSVLRGTSTADQAAYADILNRAYSTGGMEQPQDFLQSLSRSELGVVQRVHCLGAAIAPAKLSREGAYNLLLPDGYCVDLNHDGMEEIGEGRSIHFPPAEAPDSVKQAWADATNGMNEGDVLSYALVMHGMLYSLEIGDQKSVAIAPADQLDSYRQGVSNYLAMLDQVRGMLPEGQYERDKVFFSKLLMLLG